MRTDNGDVFIIDTSNPEHVLVVSLLQDYFKVANGGVIINPPIVVDIDECNGSLEPLFEKTTLTTCNAPNLPQYQVIIPIAQVFWDPVLSLPPAVEYVPAVPTLLATETAPVNFIIDLYQVQQLVLSGQNNA
ncbi:15965_t:CDS:2 [Cetraspora pellucida]|uniref:15965_t:CDS:1 n=1 Tax=Cetraspora pellucida TaxID=1433469 RepID=A0A9N9AWB2_9GLOM|nr:15965_t:CDS:2 [Cetraspora pellucida]